MSKFTAEGMRRYMDFHMYGADEGRGEYAARITRGIKPLFAKLINAKPSEIGLVVCTKAGEAAVINGLRIQESGGMDVRIVKHRAWRIHLSDMEKAMDKKTKLVSITLVSNVNGWVEDAKSISEMAHAHGAIVYADIIQAAGSVPVDVKALGIDCAACSSCKWLQGPRGAGFLYVKEDLQGSVIKDLSYPGHVHFNYEPWVSPPEPGGGMPYEAPKDGGRYEPGNVNWAGYAGEYESLQQILAMGVENIYSHTKPMCDRLKKDLPGLGYDLITPMDALSSIVAVEAKDPKGTKAKLQNGGIQVTMAQTNRFRISPAVYNRMSDIERLLSALS